MNTIRKLLSLIGLVKLAWIEGGKGQCYLRIIGTNKFGRKMVSIWGNLYELDMQSDRVYSGGRLETREYKMQWKRYE